MWQVGAASQWTILDEVVDTGTILDEVVDTGRTPGRSHTGGVCLNAILLDKIQRFGALRASFPGVLEGVPGRVRGVTRVASYIPSSGGSGAVRGRVPGSSRGGSGEVLWSSGRSGVLRRILGSGGSGGSLEPPAQTPTEVPRTSSKRPRYAQQPRTPIEGIWRTGEGYDRLALPWRFIGYSRF